jgi:hypothetical protein
MVRPQHFVPNPETIADNLFQPREPIAASDTLARVAYDEVTRMADQLRALGVTVYLFDDEDAGRPDSVFPNNWFSTHPDGRVALYPMYSPNRRTERRGDIVQSLRKAFQVNAVYDYSVLEDDELYLEGTGSMVLDHVDRVAYVARSYRSHDLAVEAVCRDLGYRPVLFSTRDLRGQAIYHTNVMMAVGTRIALVSLESIYDVRERIEVVGRLRASGRIVVPLTLKQLDEFAGNTIELSGTQGTFLVISARAHRSLTPEQVEAIEEFVRIVPVSVPTIELAGGSVRCMIAGIHLPARARRLSADVGGAASEAAAVPC